MPLNPALPVQRFRADIVATAFSPHRHDTYTFALTTRGVQDFDYRGATRRSQPGAVVVLHPDELHDGRPGDAEGFGYAGLNILPEILTRHRPGGGLPFLAGGVSRDPALISAVRAMLDLSPRSDALQQESALMDLALALDRLSDAPVEANPVTTAVVEAACEHIHLHSARGVSLDELEQLTGLDRWQLCRDFRTLRGTSPARYLTQRRLDHVRQAIAGGDRLADAAQDAGFVDQAHMSRHFKAAYGITPGHYARTIVQDPAPSHRHSVLH
ncbi:AraC family transcriptional regulator [Maricaulis maris]|uniref:AraC family transcriptional regulator n=1 Tax=Maricaulis maris TaxID=74318 RepID=UPI003B8D1748